jgi:hypothetical protein
MCEVEIKVSFLFVISRFFFIFATFFRDYNLK